MALRSIDLMVGDWVLYHNDGCIDAENDVAPYDENIQIRLSDFERDECFWADLDPIPLTPEILEKNGFATNEKAKSRKSHTIIDGDVYISWWRNRVNIVVSRRHIGLSSNHVNVDAKYVHELQHALRLCGIEKEITL